MVYLIVVNQHIVALVHIPLRKYNYSKEKRKRNVCFTSRDSNRENHHFKTPLLDTMSNFYYLLYFSALFHNFHVLGNNFALHSKVKTDVISYSIPPFPFLLLLWLPQQLLYLVELFHMYTWIHLPFSLYNFVLHQSHVIFEFLIFFFLMTYFKQ